MNQELLDLVCASYQTDECIAHCNHGSCGPCVSITNYLEANGCIVLPWKIGDTVYYITKDYKIDTDTISRLTITSTGVNPILKRHNRGFWKHYKGRWFKTLFEAEDYLEELQEWIENGN